MTEHLTIKTYRDLIVWQKAMTMVNAVYETTTRFPSSEIYGLTSQIRRAAVSIPSNIAEGYGRRGKDFARFLTISIGSLFELQTQLEIALNLGYIDSSARDRIFIMTREVERMLVSLQKKVRVTSKKILSPSAS